MTYIVLSHGLLDLGADRVALALQLENIAELHVGSLGGDLVGLAELALEVADVLHGLGDRHVGGFLLGGLVWAGYGVMLLWMVFLTCGLFDSWMMQ